VLAACAAEESPAETGPMFVPLDEPGGPVRASVTHAIAPTTLEPGEERLSCYAWTLGNEAPLYVDTVTFANEGAFHHSNWFVVPDDVYEGPDGEWDCAARGFDQFAAAQAGTVLFAQSTQAWNESMDLVDGAVVRIPARSKIVGDVHLLNTTPAPSQTRGYMTLDLIRPWDVTTVLVPLQLTYLDLSIPPNSRIRFVGQCQIKPLTGTVDIHYVLPHYHATADYFALETVDPAGTRETLLQRDGYAAGPLGHTFDPPVAWDAATDMLRFACGYDNWTTERLHWGIGIDEMCVAFALVDAPIVTSSVVDESIGFASLGDGVPEVTGLCKTLAAPRGLAYAWPDLAELEAELYLPPNVDLVDELPPAPACVDANPDVPPVAAPTLDALRTHVFRPSCALSACHGEAQAAGLRLDAGALHEQLSTHVVQAATHLPLVAPGDPEGSWLYRVVSRCDPGVGAHSMPKNMPVLLPDEVVALVHDWIAAGAPDG
jgi:hypothetical protein